MRRRSRRPAPLSSLRHRTLARSRTPVPQRRGAPSSPRRAVVHTSGRALGGSPSKGSNQFRRSSRPRRVAHGPPGHHSGSARYYADRLTIRWDHIQRSQLDAAVAALQRRGYSAGTFTLTWAWD